MNGAANHRDVAAEALASLRRGWRPVPLQNLSKRPVAEAWQNLRLGPEDIAPAFVNGHNIGVLLGEPSGWLVDIDIDAPQAVVLAPYVLPATAAIFGRQSKPRSHWLYVAPDATTKKFKDADGTMLAEVRSGGCQTMMPPSTHPSGELVTWAEDGEAAEVEATVLVGTVSRLAAAALLARHYPAQGTQHDFHLALAGCLLRGGWSAADAATFAQNVARAAGGDASRKRHSDVYSTAKRIENDGRATGWPTLAKMLGPEVCALLSEWLGLRPESQELREPPRPLRRAIPAASAFPIDALGDVVGSMARAVHERTRAPLSICANSALAAATYAVQAHADAQLPTGKIRPLSEFYLTIAESGERKSAADDENTAEIRKYEGELEEQRLNEWTDFKIDQAAWNKQRDQVLGDKAKNRELADKKTALKQLGPEPDPPLHSQLLCAEPTIEGLYRLLREGRPSIGLFSDEGGHFIGGFAMTEEHRLKTAAGLSKLWDGKAAPRTRAGEGFQFLNGKRLSMHLLMQPGVSDRVFSDPVLCDQGVISRMLAVMPESAIGTRFWREPSAESFSDFSRFSEALGKVLRTPSPLIAGKRNELQPRTLTLSDDARSLWIDFVDHLEREMGHGGSLESVRSFGNKMAEHAVRLAGILTLFENLKAAEIDAEKLAGAIELVQFYADEAIRIRETGKANLDLQTAERVLRWLHQDWKETDSGNTLISLPDFYQYGPPAIRDKETASKIVAILADHGWLIPSKPAIVNGQPRKQVWKIVREETR